MKFLPRAWRRGLTSSRPGPPLPEPLEVDLPAAPGASLTRGRDDGTGRIRDVGLPGMLVYRPQGDPPPGGRMALIVAPGGGYTHLTRLVGADGAAAAFLPRDMVVIALRYRVTPPSTRVRDDALEDGKNAVRMVRLRAQEWGIDPRRVGLLGWSAGANLALNLSGQFDVGDPSVASPLEQHSCRPDFLGLLSLWPHDRPADHYPIRPGAPPAFIATARDDRVAPAAFSEQVAAAYRAAGAPVHLWILPRGGHTATAIGAPGPGGHWPGRFWQWLAGLDLLRD